ncbi:SAM-dependent methyltransferase [Spirillospora sp. CA-253888]
MNPPADPRALTVTAQEGQYHIEAAADRNDPWPPPRDGLTTGEDNWAAVLTGTEWGPVTVHLQALQAPSAHIAPSWEMIAERDLVTATGIVEVRSIYLDNAAARLALTPGRYRLRIHVRGRALAAPYSVLETPLETHLIQLWPNPTAQDPVLLTGPDQYAEQGPEAVGSAPAAVADAPSLSVADTAAAVSQENSAFVERLMAYLGHQCSVRQFLVVNAQPLSLDLARRMQHLPAAGSRVVLVHDDPDLPDQSAQPSPELETVRADLGDPDQILAQAATRLDFDEPIAVVLLAVLPTVADDQQAYRYARVFGDRLPEGGYLAVTHDSYGHAGTEQDDSRRFSRTGNRLRTYQQVSMFLGAFVMVDGLGGIGQWDPASSKNYKIPTADEYRLGGVGRKPDPAYYQRLMQAYFPNQR